MQLNDNKPSLPFNREHLKRWVFILLLPLVNFIFCIAIMFDLGIPIQENAGAAALKLWLVFGLSYLVTSLVEAHFTQVLGLGTFWRQWLLYLAVIAVIASQFSPLLEFPSDLSFPDSMLGARIILLMEITLYLIIVRILNQQQRAFKTEVTLRETELNMLRSQSNPHFLFNTLNLINAEISNDPNNAKEIVFDLSDLLRKNIKMAQQTLTTVSDELKLVSLYLTLQQKRFKDRLTFEVKQASDTKGVKVPSLLLQPVIENTVKYGVAPYATKAHISVETNIKNDRLQILIKDTGAPFDDIQIEEGNGLRILCQTLELHYPDGYKMDLKSTSSGGEFSLLLPIQQEQTKR